MGLDDSGPKLPPEKNKVCNCGQFLDYYEKSIPDFVEVTTKDGQKKKCEVETHCSKDCGNGIPGRATVVKDGLISICLSETNKNIQEYMLVFEHELQHARDYCKSGIKGYSGCSQCTDFETSAHKVNCGMLYPDDEAKRNQCVKCAVHISCFGFCGGPLPSPCSWSLIGVDPTGFPPIENFNGK